MSAETSSAEPCDTEVITLERILQGETPILLVTHDLEDGGWQFLDGEHVCEEDGRVVWLTEILQFDRSLEELADLPVGWCAWRSAPGEPWERAEGDVPDTTATPRASAAESQPSPDRNVEIKARITNLTRLRETLEAQDAGPAEILDQMDTFYTAPAGRLKLRRMNEKQGELIHYHRADGAGPRTSHYRIAATSEPRQMKAILDGVLPVLGTVRKRRLVFHVGQTRVHLDRVEHLGDFLELEVVLRPEQSEEEGIAIARELMDGLGIHTDQLVESAYIDLLHDRSSAGNLPGDEPA